MLNRRTAVLSLAAAALAACAPMPRANPLSAGAVRALTISEIEVVTSGATFENARAAEMASVLGPDLQAALRASFADRIAPGGVRMVVEVARFNLADSARTAFGRDRSSLTGTVRLIDDGLLIATYPVQVFAGDAARTTAGALVDTAIQSSDRFYRRLLRAFSETAREQVLRQS